MSYANQEKDRRESVRITGRSLFAYKVISPEVFSEVKTDFEAGISLYTQDHLLDLQVFIGAQKALSNIRERDADMAEFLQHLDMKINVLLKKSSGGKTPLDYLKLRDINLSATGLAFISKTPLEKDTIVEIQLAFLPSYTFVYGFAMIRKCEKMDKVKDQQFYRISAQFTLIMDDDREALIQHNFKQQSLALRNRKKNSNR